jgi:EpsD family peptidyl-prolyl cis-trans isomerase
VIAAISLGSRGGSAHLPQIRRLRSDIMEFEMRRLSMRLCRLAAVVGCCGLMLAGCSKKADQAVAGSQVVAHIGGDVVTTQELDNEFRLANVPADKRNDPAFVKRVLGELVVRKYLVQQALNEKLDREPGVLLDILRSREQVLENAFLRRTVASKAPSKADIDQYIASSPWKFANRMIFSVDQIGFPLSSTTQAVVDASKEAKSLDEIDQQLTSAGIVHSRQTGMINSGEIPQDLYDLIEAKKPDEVFFIRAGANGVFFKVKGEESHPLEGEAAASFARQLIGIDALKAEAGLASYSANIEAKYEGDYAKIMQGVGDKKG